MTTPRRRAIWLIRQIAKLPAAERFWVLQSFFTGCVPPADENKFERDVRIRRYRKRWHADLSELAAVAAIAREADRYRAAGWRRDQHLTSKPAHLRGTANGDLFDILKWDDIPGASAIKTILRSGS
jgi:hypothetical protein